VPNISYNAKGQREYIEFGNDTYSEYFYDEKTFRLKQIITQRDADTEPLQDINYVYDAVGNIVYVKDNAQQTFYFDSSIINPESFYTYDALYRLIEATGRESFTNTGNFYEENPVQALGGNDVQNYERSFEYDLVGNITKMQHGAGANSFTKHFHYENNNNQLTRIFIGNSVSALESYTYDAHGNMLASYDRQFTYNLFDQLQVVDITGGSWKALYMYNAEGQRDRKTVSNLAGIKDRFYFQNYERYQELDNADDLVLERYSYHITDGEKKVATLDKETGSNTLYRYQYGNNLGSVGLELDDSAAIISYEEYYPFGGTSYYAHNHHIDVPLNRYKYCGKEQDEETGLYYYGARYYAPWLCRFTSVDPKALEYVHQSTYVYAANSPVRYIDINGEGILDYFQNPQQKQADAFAKQVGGEVVKLGHRHYQVKYVEKFQEEFEGKKYDGYAINFVDFQKGKNMNSTLEKAGFDYDKIIALNKTGTDLLGYQARNLDRALYGEKGLVNYADALDYTGNKLKELSLAAGPFAPVVALTGEVLGVSSDIIKSGLDFKNKEFLEAGKNSIIRLGAFASNLLFEKGVSKVQGNLPKELGKETKGEEVLKLGVDKIINNSKDSLIKK
jgi:RHS repeat-associated protein